MIFRMKYNRIEEGLDESQRSQKWLSDQVSISVVSVSNWCQNHKQPSLKTIHQIADVLKYKPNNLINNETKSN